MTRAWSVLLNSTILGGALTIGVWIVLRLVPRRLLNATTRHVIWWLLLIATMALPFVKFYAREAPNAAIQSSTSAPPSKGNAPVAAVKKASPTRLKHKTIEPAATLRTPKIAPTPSASISTLTVPVSVSGWRWLWILSAVWLLVSTLLFLRLIADYVALERQKARAMDVSSGLSERAANWLAKCRVHRGFVRLAISKEIDIPIAAGPSRPSIMIPAALLDALERGELGEEEFDQIGLHETAHIARYDDYALLVERIVEAALFLHPVVRWITRQIDLEREIACDDFVVGLTKQPCSYASCLTRIAETFPAVGPSLVAAPVANDLSDLTRRVELLLDRTRHTGTRILRGRLGSMAVILALLGWSLARIPAFIAFATPLIRAVQHIPAAFVPQTAISNSSPAQRVSSQSLEARIIDDSSGNALASVELRFHRIGMRELAADLETDREGIARSSDLPSGDYTVDVSKPNYLTATFPIHVPGEPLTVRLSRYGVIEGHTMDHTGRPLEAIIRAPEGWTMGSSRIVILTKAPGTDDLREFRTTKIDEAGRYRVFDLPPGEYAVGLWYAGLSVGSGVQLYPDNSHPQVFTVSGGEEYREINFSIAPAAYNSISGAISLPNPGDTFALALSLPDQPALPIAQTQTRPDGTFRFDKISIGAYDLFVAGPVNGYGMYDSVLGGGDPRFGRVRVQIAGQNIDNFQVPIAPGRSLSARLRAHDSESQPVGCPQFAQINAKSLEPWGVMFRISAQVSFLAPQKLSNLPPGRFQLVATGLGNQCYQTAPPIVDLNSDPTNPVEIEVATAGSIRGTLKPTSNAKPTDFVVVLVDAEGNSASPSRFVKPDASGRFSFDALPPGPYRIAAPLTHDKYSRRWIGNSSQMVEINVFGGRQTAVELRP